jgi:hypothetical protein
VTDDGLSAGAAARRLGVAVTTLRTWHQRYGLGPSRHEAGHHRRYTVEDMGRLEVMRQLTAQGVAPAEAAAWAQRSPAAVSPTSPASSPSAASAPTAAISAGADGVGGSVDEPPDPLSDLVADPPSGLAVDASAGLSVDALPGVSVDAPAGGGQNIALGVRADPAARGLARAAMRLDGPSMRFIIEGSVAGRGVIPSWTHVIMPVLIGIGERYEATARFVEVEHLLSRSVTEALATVPRPPHDQTPRVLLAAADEEHHTLPLEALAAALAENGVPTRMFGARVPSQALVDAIRRTGPAVVVLWSQLPGTGDVRQLERLLDVPHPPMLIAAAGPGWPATGLPPTVTALSNLADAVRVISAGATL